MKAAIRAAIDNFKSIWRLSMRDERPSRWATYEQYPYQN